MKIEAVCTNADQVEFSMTISGSLWDWKRLKESMINSDISSQLNDWLRCQISELVDQFEHAKFMPKNVESDDPRMTVHPSTMPETH